MGRNNRDSEFDDGLVTRSQQADYGKALLQMGAPRSKTPRIMSKIFVWGFVIAMPLLLILALSLSNANRSLNVELSKTLETQYNPSFKVRYADIGEQTINAWYANQTPPINIDSSIQWNAAAPAALSGPVVEGAEEGGTSPATGDSADEGTQLDVTNVSFWRGNQVETRGFAGRYEERLEYYANVNGVPHIIGITIAIPKLDDLTSDPVLVSAPAIISKPMVSTISNDPAANPKSELGEANLTDASEAAARAWAKAWTEDDPDALKRATQDSDAENIYRGLGGGWRFVDDSLAVQWSAAAPSGSGNAVARVTWSMQTPSTTIPATTGESASPAQVIPGAIQTQTMDILVGKFESGTPSILSWGQSGTYMDLTPQKNALTKEEAEKLSPQKAPSEEPTDAP